MICPGAPGFPQSSTCGTHGTQSSACAVPTPSPRAAAPSATAIVAVPAVDVVFVGFGVAFGVYYAHLFGGGVIRAIFKGDQADFGFLETTLKF